MLVFDTEVVCADPAWNVSRGYLRSDSSDGGLHGLIVPCDVGESVCVFRGGVECLPWWRDEVLP